jgi:GR25 family glycosyltransferase involved in LPS biosynthesis
MIFNQIFNNIYVLNLKSSTDRKMHIETEFKRVNIEKYQFFEATPHDSDDVKNLMNSTLVKKFPNCFRCNMKRCNCENNFLTPYQIANWCSFINIFHDILKNKYNFVLICEDDIVFTHQHRRIIDTLLSKESFNYYKIDMNKPLLIRLGTAFNPDNHNSTSQPIFIKNFSLCNPCFAINYQMACVYLKYLKIIDYHSDVYFHKKIPKNIKGLQYFTMYPYPIYELSFVKSKQKFASLVRPQNAYRRMEYKEFLFLSSNVLIQVLLKKIVKIMNLDIRINSIGFNGTIDSYIFLNDNEKKKYYFEHKLLITDNEEDDINILTKNIDLKYYQNYISKIENYQNNNKLLYEYIMKLLDSENILKININNEEHIKKLYKFINKDKLHKAIQNYISIKNINSIITQ